MNKLIERFIFGIFFVFVLGFATQHFIIKSKLQTFDTNLKKHIGRQQDFRLQMLVLIGELSYAQSLEQKKASLLGLQDFMARFFKEESKSSVIFSKHSTKDYYLKEKEQILHLQQEFLKKIHVYFGQEVQEELGQPIDLNRQEVQEILTFLRGISYKSQVIEKIFQGELLEQQNTTTSWRYLVLWGVVFLIIFMSIWVVAPFTRQVENTFAELSYTKEKLQAVNHELEKRIEVRNKLVNRTHARLSAILESANLTIMSTDLDGIIQTFNPTAEQMLQYSSIEVVGNLSPVYFHDKSELSQRAREYSLNMGNDIRSPFEILVNKARAGKSDEREWRYISKKGIVIPVLLMVTPLRDEDRKIMGFLFIAYDMTERQKIEKMKTEFISTVSHELRTPLASIRGGLGLLLGGVAGILNPKMKELLDISHKNSDRLLHLINEILDMEKIAEQKMEYIWEEVNVSELIKDSLSENQILAQQAGITFTYMSPELQAKIWADPKRLKQILANLLSNCSKFTVKGDEVVVKAERNKNWVRILVTDHGPGITQDKQHLIFQKFTQLDASDSRRGAGTGLGLHICKAMVEDLKGRMGFESIPYKETTFYFEFPEVT
ncbi:MAG: PAS domain S-box protein [Bacteriovoracaceae bacterium]|nr:PAS domain S-box protein [Bacteriovoracaceae bacterium]